MLWTFRIQFLHVCCLKMESNFLREIKWGGKKKKKKKKVKATNIYLCLCLLIKLSLVLYTDRICQLLNNVFFCLLKKSYVFTWIYAKNYIPGLILLKYSVCRTAFDYMSSYFRTSFKTKLVPLYSFSAISFMISLKSFFLQQW